jgi:hypothetical protein
MVVVSSLAIIHEVSREQDGDDPSVVIPSTIFGDTSLALPLTSEARPKAILSVDASCPNSLYALERALADSLVVRHLALGYYPQVGRDPVARFETTALECARQLGALSRYVTQRLDDVGRGGRAVELSAHAAGLDTAQFMGCVADVRTDAVVVRHEKFAESSGVASLPLLVHQGVGEVGRDRVIEALPRLR